MPNTTTPAEWATFVDAHDKSPQRTHRVKIEATLEVIVALPPGADVDEALSEVLLAAGELTLAYVAEQHWSYDDPMIVLVESGVTAALGEIEEIT